jgi:signal transduction histidine kinase
MAARPRHNTLRRPTIHVQYVSLLTPSTPAPLPCSGQAPTRSPRRLTAPGAHRVRSRRLVYDLTLGWETLMARCAAMLHDRVVQDLYGLRLLTSLDRPEMEEELATIAEAARALTVRLAPPTLESEGLDAALASLCHDSGRELQIALHVDAHTIVEPSSVFLFRIAQEALENVRQHAQATYASVTLTPAGPDLRLVISDNGDGFDPEQALPGAGSGFGLCRARAYAYALGGSLVVRSAPGLGTTVSVRIPWGGPHLTPAQRP